MRKSDLSKLRSLLEDKRARLLADMKRIEDDIGGLPKPGDPPLPDYGKEIALGLHENEAKEVQNIEDALKKIEAGTYGACEACKGEIRLTRLKIIPSARLCLECQRKEDGE